MQPQKRAGFGLPLARRGAIERGLFIRNSCFDLAEVIPVTRSAMTISEYTR